MNTRASVYKVGFIALILATTSVTSICQNHTPLTQAAWSGDAKRVKQLLAQGADINEKNALGFTALMDAAISQQKPVVDVLLAEGADVNVIRTVSGYTALLAAAAGTNTDILNAIIKNGANVNAKDNWGHTPVIEAALSGKPDNVKILQGAGASFTNDLVYTSALGQMESVQQFLRDKADINATNQIGWTPLAAAAAANQPAIVKLLLEKGADVNAQGMNGDDRETALAFASEKGHAEVVKLLLAKRADPKIREFNTKTQKPDDTALVEAVTSGHAEVLKLLLDAGADPNEMDFSGKPVLCRAAQDNPVIVKMLLDKGADVNAQISAGPNKGSTALISATFMGNAESVRLLLSKGARVSAKNSQGMTSLQIAEALREQEQSPQKQRAREQIVQLLSNPDAAVKDLADLKSTPKADSTKMTKAEWRRRVAPYDPSHSPVQVITAQNFKRTFGEPSKTQTVDLKLYWYYECADGTIQIVLNDPNATGGIMAIDAINDY